MSITMTDFVSQVLADRAKPLFAKLTFAESEGFAIGRIFIQNGKVIMHREYFIYPDGHFIYSPMDTPIEDIDSCTQLADGSLSFSSGKLLFLVKGAENGKK